MAACWHGLARRITRDLVTHAKRPPTRTCGPQAGRAVATLASSSTLLAAAGRQIDESPRDEAAARRRAVTVRVGVEQLARNILGSSVAAAGRDRALLRPRSCPRVTDLTVYLGQLHFGVDAASVDIHAGDDWWSS